MNRLFFAFLFLLSLSLGRSSYEPDLFQFNVQEDFYLDFNDFVCQNCSAIYSELVGIGNTEPLLASCELIPSQYSVASSSELILPNSANLYNHRIVYSGASVFLLSDPDSFIVYSIDPIKGLSQKKQLLLTESQKPIIKGFLKMVVDTANSVVFLASGNDLGCFEIGNESISFNHRLINDYLEDDEITSAVMRHSHILISLKFGGLLVFEHSGACQLELISSADSDFFGEENLSLIDVAVHPSLNKVMVADRHYNRLYMLDASEDMKTLTLLEGYLQTGGIERVLVAQMSVWLVGKNIFRTKNIIQEFQATSREAASWASLGNLTVEREYSITSNPIEYHIDDEMFYIVVENLIFLIKHSVPKKLVLNSLDLVSKQTWEGVNDLIPLSNGAIIVNTPETPYVGRISHVGPALSCHANPNATLGEFDFDLYLVLSSEDGSIASQKESLEIKAFLPFFKDPKLAFGLGMIIGAVILVILTGLYCYKYCKLKKDYEVLKEQSMSMSHYRYEKKGKEDKEPVGNILGDEAYSQKTNGDNL